MEQVWALLHIVGQWVSAAWHWFTFLPWALWLAAFTRMTLPEWMTFLASLAGISAFVIGIPRLRSFHYTQRYRVFVELYKLNEQLMSRLRSNDVTGAKMHREALRDYIHANSFEFSPHDNAHIYAQWQKANAQANTLIRAIEEDAKKHTSLADIGECFELRDRLNTEIQKLRKTPLNDT